MQKKALHLYRMGTRKKFSRFSCKRKRDMLYFVTVAIFLTASEYRSVDLITIEASGTLPPPSLDRFTNLGIII